MSNFKRRITDVDNLKDRLTENDPFLKRIYDEHIRNGQALLTFRNEEATIYYNGNQLCNIASSDDFDPSVYNHYLPLIRSETLRSTENKRNYNESEWIGKFKINKTFSDMYEEILDNIKKEEKPESHQASGFYKFSPLNLANSSEIVLLDIEAAFSFTGQDADRIDLVLYHKTERRLIFIEVKRLYDNRMKLDNNSNPVKFKSQSLLNQLNRYRKRINTEAQQINNEYNIVIDYYNRIGNLSLQPIDKDSIPAFGLLVVEFTRNTNDSDKIKKIKQIVKTNGFVCYSIGDTSRTDEKTLAAIYKAVKKT